MLTAARPQILGPFNAPACDWWAAGRPWSNPGGLEPGRGRQESGRRLAAGRAKLNWRSFMEADLQSCQPPGCTCLGAPALSAQLGAHRGGRAPASPATPSPGFSRFPIPNSARGNPGRGLCAAPLLRQPGPWCEATYPERGLPPCSPGHTWPPVRRIPGLPLARSSLARLLGSCPQGTGEHPGGHGPRSPAPSGRQQTAGLENRAGSAG